MSISTEVENFIARTGLVPDILAIALRTAGREQCSNCDQWTDEGLTEIGGCGGGDGWCYVCRDNDAHFCESCENYTTEYTSTVCVSAYRRRTEEWCDTCVEDTHGCEDCGELHTDGSDGLRHTDWGDSYCEGCWDDRFVYCDECDEYHDGSSGPCTRAAIHAYGSIPPQGWVPVGKGPKFGVEIEVENADSRYDVVANAEETYELLKGLDGGIWITHDGSLHNGYEITSQPLSLEVWRNNREVLTSAFSGLVDRGVRAWDRNNSNHPVGIHVHIDRESFISDYHLLRFLHLFRNLHAGWKGAAGRDCHYASFDGLRQLKAKATQHGRSAHSDAVSVRNDTVEVRVFRSSLAADRLLGDIELVAAACEFTRKARYESVSNRVTLKNDWQKFLSDNYPLAFKVWTGYRFTVKVETQLEA